MKIKFFVFALVASFMFSGCVKEDLAAELAETAQLEQEMNTEGLDAIQARAAKTGPPVSVPCETAFFAQNMPAGTVAYLSVNQTIIATFVNTLYITLQTNTTYQIFLPGCEESVKFCSCGENYGTLIPVPGGTVVTFTTSSDGTPYSTCTF